MLAFLWCYVFLVQTWFIIITSIEVSQNDVYICQHQNIFRVSSLSVNFFKTSIIVPTFVTKITEYLCSGWVIFPHTKFLTIYLAIFDNNFLYQLKSIVVLSWNLKVDNFKLKVFPFFAFCWLIRLIVSALFQFSIPLDIRKQKKCWKTFTRHLLAISFVQDCSLVHAATFWCSL